MPKLPSHWLSHGPRTGTWNRSCNRRIGDPGILDGGWDQALAARFQEPTIGLPTFNTAILTKDTVLHIGQCLHPSYCHQDWREWRLAYEGGRAFVNYFLKRFSRREKPSEFEARRAIATIPAFAASAIQDINNAIFQRMVDISRQGGSPAFQSAVAGEGQGVNRGGASLTGFIGTKIIPDLLVMKRIGIYVDAPATRPAVPYLYTYRSEDILNWYPDPGCGPLQLLVLRDHVQVLHPVYRVPIGWECRYRLLYLDPNGGVGVVVFAEDGKTVLSQTTLAVPEIPFVLPTLSHSLMMNVCGHQSALLNLESTDLAFLLKANFPIYTEQQSSTTGAKSHLTAAPSPNGDGSDNPTDAEMGVSHGRSYGRGLDRPEFIAPPTGPVEASMKKQQNLKDDIRNLVNLAAASVKSVSAEAKAMDNLGLESGLSNIGLELQEAERSIARIWAAYEANGKPPAKIKYPDRYSLKTDSERNAEADAQLGLKKKIPSQRFQNYINHKVVNILVGDRLPSDELAKIHAELDASKAPTSDPDQLRLDMGAGLVTAETVSSILGYPNGEVPKAQEEYAIRLRQIAVAQGGLKPNPQTESGLTNPASRGVADLAPVGDHTASAEKIGKPKRGKSNGQA